MKKFTKEEWDEIDRIHQFDYSIRRIAGHVGACCGGVDVIDDNGLGSHTSEEIIRRIDELVRLNGGYYEYKDAFKAASDVCEEARTHCDVCSETYDTICKIQDAILALPVPKVKYELVLPRFPVMLRKMWSGTEVQQWIDANIRPLTKGE